MNKSVLNFTASAFEQTEEVAELLDAATATNTRLAYQNDLSLFVEWGGKLPATTEQIVAYLQEMADQINPTTLQRRVLALHHWHTLKKLPDPTQDILVKQTLAGICRKYGRPAKKVAPYLLSDIDLSIGYWEQEDTLLALRDRALILVGFHVAGRRSELADMRWEHIDYAEEGMVIRFPRSKTDQYSQGARCSIPVGSTKKRCPLQALLDWRKESGYESGPVFRGLSKGEAVVDRAISPYQVNERVKYVARAANLPNAPTISAHSLRRGFATEASRRGVSLQSIMQHGRWKSLKTVLEYIDEGRVFMDSPLKALY